MGADSDWPTTARIAVVGHGLTAYACVAALAQLGYGCDLLFDLNRFDLARTDFRGPPLVLNDVGKSLLAVLFPDVDFCAPLCYPLSHRWVRWGARTEAELVYQPALALRSRTLLTLLQHSDCIQRTAIIDASQLTAAQVTQSYDWIIYASPQQAALVAPTPACSFVGGQRTMIVAEIVAQPPAVPTSQPACYIESLKDGWLFYAPCDCQGATLQLCLPAVPDPPRRALLESVYQSMLIGPLVNDLQTVQCFASAPRLQWPLCGPGWLRVGEAAIKLDPVSGEGTPFALRSAILAAATIDAVLRNSVVQESHQVIPHDAALNHYQSRLAQSFLAHLQGCVKFYQDAFRLHPAWCDEMNLMVDAGAALSAQVQNTTDNWRYRLVGFELRA